MSSKINKILLNKKNILKVFTDKGFTTETDFLNKIAGCLNNGVNVIVLKFSSLSSSEFIDIAKKTRELASYFNSLLFIYDRIDIAKIVFANGVILDKNTMLPNDACKILNDDFLTGYDLSHKETVSDINLQNVDFIVEFDEKSQVHTIRQI